MIASVGTDGEVIMSAAKEADLDAPVMVVGGSMIGLATAMYLAQQGVEVLSIEKHHGTAIHPRAGYFQLPTNDVVALPELLIARGENEEALGLVARIPESDRTRRVAAKA